MAWTMWVCRPCFTFALGCMAVFCFSNIQPSNGNLTVGVKAKWVYYTTGTSLRNQVLVSIANIESWKLEVDAGQPSSLANYMRTNGRGHLSSFPMQFDWGFTNLFPIIAVVITVTNHANNETQSESLEFPVWELGPANYLTADPELEQRIVHLSPNDAIVREVLTFAIDEYSNTRMLSPSRVLRAVLWTPFDGRKLAVCMRTGAADCTPTTASEVRVFITLQLTEESPSDAEDGSTPKFLVGVRVGREAAPGASAPAQRWKELIAAEELHADFMEERSRLSFEESVADGSCPAREPQIDADLGPWETTGGMISEEAVAHQALPEAWNRYCNRVTIVNGSLAITWAHQDQAYPPTARGNKWYTQLLLETLASTLASFRVPDADFCTAEETPQTLRASNLPLLTFTKSTAHMDILIPDVFFKYWHLPSHLVPHPWYKPPQNLATLPEGARAWEQRVGKVYWRGTVSEWAMNSRGRLCIIASTRPDLFDVRPLRIVGDALRQRWDGIEAFQEVLDKQGAGTEADPAEVFSYKFVVNTHGNGNEWNNRFRSLLSSGAVVFKQAATLFEFWEGELVPFQHFIPVRADLSDLVAKVEWAIQNDAAAKQIAVNAMEFVRSRISYRRAECYWAHLLTRYSRLQAFSPAVPPNASRVLNLALIHRADGARRG